MNITVGSVVRVRSGKLYLMQGTYGTPERAFFVQLRDTGIVSNGCTVYREYGPSARELNLAHATYVGQVEGAAGYAHLGRGFRHWKEVAPVCRVCGQARPAGYDVTCGRSECQEAAVVGVLVQTEVL